MFIKKPFWHYALSCFATEPEGGSNTEDPPGDDTGQHGGEQSGSTGETKLNEHGYPDETPIKDMTADQQAAYWKYHAQKHERRSKEREDYDAIKAERDRLKQSTMTDAEKQIEEAREEGKALAAQEYSDRMVDAMLRGTLKGHGLKADDIDSRLSFIDRKAFLTDNGEVDSDKVNAYLEANAPGEKKKESWPDTGGGNRGGGKGLGGSVQAGKDLYAQRRGK